MVGENEVGNDEGGLIYLARYWASGALKIDSYEIGHERNPKSPMEIPGRPGRTFPCAAYDWSKMVAHAGDWEREEKKVGAVVECTS